MKVVAGRLTDTDRAILFESNATGRRVLVAALTADVTYAQRGDVGQRESMQAVGTVTGWTHDDFTVRGWSFATRIRWADAVRVWWRDEAPSDADVDAILAEHVTGPEVSE